MLPTNPLLNATTPAGPHLPVGLLRQYAAGTLAPASQHRVEAHTLACPRCADILAGLQQTTAATTDQALAKLQQRLRQRVQQQAAPARYDREKSQNRWLIPQLAAAAALLLGLVAGGWWAWQQRHLSPKAPAVATRTVAPTKPALTAAPPTIEPPATTPAPVAKPLASRARQQSVDKPLATTTPARNTRQSSAGAPLLHSSTFQVDTAAPHAVATEPAPASAAAPLANASAPAIQATDSSNLTGKLAVVAKRKLAETSYAAPLARMPAAPKVPPAPLGGYSALREKLRREATEFKPEALEQPLSGTVQLRLTIGADGKIQQTKVLRGLREDYDAEAQRLVCDGPNWIPGISGGKRAPLEIDIAIPF